MPSTPAVHVGPQENPRLVEAVERGGGRVVPLAEAEAVVVSGGHGDLPELPDAVRWVQLPSAGIEAWVESGVVDSSRTWTSATGAYSHAVAEGAVALLLAGVRGIGRAARLTTWDNAALDGVQTSLRGSTIAVVGAGGIGSAMIPAFTALGAEVVAVTRRGLPVEGAVRTLPADRVGEVFAAADHVVLAAPATARTRALVGAEQLAAIGPRGWLVNIARGSLVDTDALVGGARGRRHRRRRARRHRPRAAARRAPAVVRAARASSPRTPRTRRRCRSAALAGRVEENVRRFAAGEDLLGLVDPERGY